MKGSMEVDVEKKVTKSLNLPSGRTEVSDRFLDFSCAKVCGYCGQEFYRDKRCTWAHWSRAKFCSRRCTSSHNSLRADLNRPSMRDAFSRWFTKGEGCWEWAGAVDKDGYGIFTYAGKNYRAPRMSLKLDGRALTSIQHACHTCDNPSCVRPSHLYPGSPKDNEDDKDKRGRRPLGEDVYCSKLKSSEVLEIRKSNEDSKTLALRYGVSKDNIVAIRSRLTWKHLP